MVSQGFPNRILYCTHAHLLYTGSLRLGPLCQGSARAVGLAVDAAGVAQVHPGAVPPPQRCGLLAAVDALLAVARYTGLESLVARNEIRPGRGRTIGGDVRSIGENHTVGPGGLDRGRGVTLAVVEGSDRWWRGSVGGPVLVVARLLELVGHGCATRVEGLGRRARLLVLHRAYQGRGQGGIALDVHARRVLDLLTERLVFLNKL